MRKSARDKLVRRRPFREPRPRLLIVCEGKETEKGYFLDLRHHEKSLIDLEVRPGGVPKTLVEKAVQLKRDAERQARREKNSYLRYDHVWCVFDIDEHPHIADAKQQARDNRVELAISNPCFELWLVLHFQDQRSYITRSAVHHECVKYLPEYEKKIPFVKIYANYQDAVQRACALRAWQESRGSAEDANPWTAVQTLTEIIKSYSRNKPATQI
jgi:hypothetical protein